MWKRRVGQPGPDVDIKRFMPVLFDKAQGFIDDQIGGAGPEEPVGHAAGFVEGGVRKMPKHPVTGREMTGHEGGAAGRTHRAVHIELGELGALPGQPVNVRRFGVGEEGADGRFEEVSSIKHF